MKQILSKNLVVSDGNDNEKSW